MLGSFRALLVLCSPVGKKISTLKIYYFAFTFYSTGFTVLERSSAYFLQTPPGDCNVLVWG